MKAARPGETMTVRIAVLAGEGVPAPARLAGAVREALQPAAPLLVEAVRVKPAARDLARAIRGWCDRDRVDLVLTVGMSGPGAGDFAPEATAALLGRSLPGIEERMYLAPPRRPEELLFRGRAGFRRGTLVVNLPERLPRLKAIVRFLAPVLRHAVEKARGSERECGGAGEAR